MAMPTKPKGNRAKDNQMHGGLPCHKKSNSLKTNPTPTEVGQMGGFSCVLVGLATSCLVLLTPLYAGFPGSRCTGGVKFPEFCH